MPLFSCLNPFGQLRFSSAPSTAEKIYHSMRAGYSDPRTGKPAIDMTVGSHAEAKLYATAKAIAASQVTLERAGNNLKAITSYELLRAHGDRFGVKPATGQAVKDYRDEVDLAARYPLGSTHAFMVSGLTTILGDALVEYRITPQADVTRWPATPGTGPGLFSRPDLPSKTVRFLAPVTPATLPSAVWVLYENWEPDEPQIRLTKNTILCIEAENLSQVEKVTVTDAVEVVDGLTFLATFTKSHDQGASATTGPVPIWFSTRRIALVITTPAAAIDPELVRRVDEFMERNSRDVTQWAIVQDES
jgi:hypothetical protein